VTAARRYFALRNVLLLSGSTVSVFSPANLFAAGEQGAWYDPSDFSTMFQDAAGTTPVTATDQSVGLILDKSGRGNNASQSTLAARPLLKQDENGCYFLLFDGSDDALATASIDFSVTNKVSVFAGARKLSDALTGGVVQLSNSTSGNNGVFALFAPFNTGAGADYAWQSKGTARITTTSSVLTGAETVVLTGIGDIAAPSAILRRNAVQVASSTGSQGSGSFGNYVLNIGGPNYFNGRLYGLVVVGRSVTTTERDNTETWINGKTKAY